MKRRGLLGFGIGVLSALALRSSFGQTKYPERPVRLVIPYPPGGVYDGTGRPWADKAKAHFGTIVIENIGGAGSSLGTAAAARAKPDGYTILLGGNSGLVINPIAATRPLYDPIKDFDPIAVVGRNPTAIVVNPAPQPSTDRADRPETAPRQSTYHPTQAAAVLRPSFHSAGSAPRREASRSTRRSPSE